MYWDNYIDALTWAYIELTTKEKIYKLEKFIEHFYKFISFKIVKKFYELYMSVYVII